jgi:hypothetical protein
MYLVKLFGVEAHAEQFLDIKFFRHSLFDSLFIHSVMLKVASKEALKLSLKAKLLSQF